MHRLRQRVRNLVAIAAGIILNRFSVLQGSFLEYADIRPTSLVGR